jgi:hypothetical protein
MSRNLNRIYKEKNKRNRLKNKLMKKNNRQMKIITMKTNKANNKSLIPTNRTFVRLPTAKRRLKNKKSPPRLPNN